MSVLRSAETLTAANKGRSQSILRASLLAITPSLLAFVILVALGIETVKAPPSAFDPAFVAYSVLLAPAVETAVMLGLAAVLMRWLPRHVELQIVLIALIAALAHKLGGGWRQVVNTAWPTFVYATTLVLWSRRSMRDALIVTTAVHALYNAAFFVVGILGALAITH